MCSSPRRRSRFSFWPRLTGTDPSRLVKLSAYSTAITSGALSPWQLPPNVQEIRVGEEVNDTLTSNGYEKLFDLTAPRDGILVVRLSWDPQQGWPELAVENRWFAALGDTQTVRRSAGSRKERLAPAVIGDAQPAPAET